MSISGKERQSRETGHVLVVGKLSELVHLCSRRSPGIVGRGITELGLNNIEHDQRPDIQQSSTCFTPTRASNSPVCQSNLWYSSWLLGERPFRYSRQFVRQYRFPATFLRASLHMLKRRCHCRNGFLYARLGTSNFEQ